MPTEPLPPAVYASKPGPAPIPGSRARDIRANRPARAPERLARGGTGNRESAGR